MMVGLYYAKKKGWYLLHHITVSSFAQDYLTVTKFVQLSRVTLSDKCGFPVYLLSLKLFVQIYNETKRVNGKVFD